MKLAASRARDRCPETATTSSIYDSIVALMRILPRNTFGAEAGGGARAARGAPCDARSCAANPALGRVSLRALNFTAAFTHDNACIIYERPAATALKLRVDAPFVSANCGVALTCRTIMGYELVSGRFHDYFFPLERATEYV
ncbi:hypothetical protein EVAR_51982_1 [Eumeta japonica]|uniref:Uncharacterized protein n=1 Tax=Eumeta variegata TaxID=151549 RepID=A0A4C1Y5J5_EUMVA|nr:hypothetical protein EVAR_51982_1 [Eumeta japonica]